MNRFYAWLYRKCVNAADDRNTPYTSDKPTLIREIDNGPCTDGMNIKVWGATGGHIVEFRRYDHKTDRHDNRMYIISADQNFSESLTKIITLEMYR